MNGEVNKLKKELAASKEMIKSLESELSFYRENEQGMKFGPIIQKIPDPVVLTKLNDGTILDVNTAFLNLTGYKYDEVVGKSTVDVKIFKTNANRSILLEKIKSGKQENIPLSVFNKKGEEVEGLISAAIISSDKENILLTVFRDVSDLRKSERNAQESLRRVSELEEKFRTFLEHSPCGIAITDGEGAIQDWSKRMAELTGITMDQAMGQDPDQMNTIINDVSIGRPVLKEMFDKFHNFLNNADAEFIEDKYKLSLNLPDTGRIDLENTFFSFKTSSGLKFGILSRDISDQRHQDENILLYKMIFENNLDGIAILDLDNNYLIVNDALPKILGYSKEELIGEKPRLFLGEQLFKEILQVYDYQKSFEGDLIGKSKNDSELNLDYTLFPVFSNDIQVCTVEIIRDNTLRKKSEKDLLISKRKAETADKLKTAFLSNMSHEIRTPMNSIIGFASLLENPDLTDEKKAKYLNFINKNGKSLLNIINDILDVAKIESNQINIKKTNGDLTILLDNLFETALKLKQKEGKDLVTLKKSYKENENLQLFTDFHRLEQVLLNITYNAIKFTDSGFIEIGYNINESEKEIIFHVKDTGIGISKSNIKTIFERFSRLEDSNKKVYSGAGLGLAISSQLVSLLEGEIWVESVEGDGATFFISLPLTQIEKIEKEIEIVEDVVIPKDWSGKRILIVEDDQYSYDLLNEYLKDTGIEITHTTSGEKAVGLFAGNMDLDIILMDIKLPGISGLEAIKLILEMNPETIIIAQTAFAMQEDQVKIIEAGCKDYLAKPISKNMFFKLLNKFL